VLSSRNNSQLRSTCSIECTQLASAQSAAADVGMFSVLTESDVMPYFQDAIDTKRHGNVSYEKSSVVGSDFSLVTQGGENVTLLGDTMYRTLVGPFFLPGLHVHVGNHSCDFTLVNSSTLVVRMPNITTMFPDANGAIVCLHATASIDADGSHRYVDHPLPRGRVNFPSHNCCTRERRG
jgi:hypothetical protein